MAVATKIDAGRQLKDASITKTQMANDSVGSNQIESNAVIEAKIANSAVSSDKIADSAVVSRTIADGAVTGGKFATTLGRFNEVIATVASGTDSVFKLGTQAKHNNLLSLYLNGQKLTPDTAFGTAAPGSAFDYKVDVEASPNTVTLGFDTSSGDDLHAMYIGT